MSDSYVSFNCADCGEPLTIDEGNPPDDHEVINCSGCGQEIGEYGSVRKALMKATKAEVDEIVKKTFGKGIDWK